MGRIALAKPGISFADHVRSHVRMMRLDHSVKQLFIAPGILTAYVFCGLQINTRMVFSVLAGLVGMTLIASSNYVLNELLDAPYDRLHPTKRFRPAAVGSVTPSLAYAQWLLLALGGGFLWYEVSTPV